MGDTTMASNHRDDGGPSTTESTMERPVNAEPVESYMVTVSCRFLVMSSMACILLAFAVGRGARIILLEGPRRALLAPHQQSPMRNRPDYHEGGLARLETTLPAPVTMHGRSVPHTIYTSKNFDTARTATSSSILIRRNTNNGDEVDSETISCSADDDNELKQCARGRVETEDDEDFEHLPAGQHLLVDIKNVDGSFLNSEERLAHSMIEVVMEAQLTLLSYHCHTLVPTGVSCVGVLLESHVSFHTWPSEGVITIDLFTCGSNPLLPVVPIIERVFSVPLKPSFPGEVVEPLQLRWAHKLRGFRPDTVSSPLQTWDFGTYILGMLELDMKKEIASVKTNYQQIDIYDVIFPRFNTIDNYKQSLANNGSYQSRHPDFYAPDRIVMLDGILQSRRSGDAAYHEALVHPAMFAHDNPKRVAIVGAGEGAALREVLKHNRVKEAIMIEIDELLVNVSRSHLPDWGDCSDLVGSAPWCVEDPRTEIYYQDALVWFSERYSGEQIDGMGLDVIIMDALDPQDNLPVAQAIYNNDTFMRTLFNSLAHDGILVMQLGDAPLTNDPDEMQSRRKDRAAMMSLLERTGFESIHVYEESHAGFTAPWSYLAAFKEYRTRRRWYANEAEIELAIRKRAMKSKSGKNVFRYFDGATMVSYQVPSRGWENVYCRRIPQPPECEDGRGFIPDAYNVPASSLEVKASTVSEKAGRGVFAKEDIPKSSYIDLDATVQSLFFPPSALKLIMTLDDLDAGEALGVVVYYIEGYGFHGRVYGEQEAVVDSGIMTFANHGCNRTYNVGFVSDIDEFSADVENMPAELSGKSHARTSVYSPVNDRNLRHLLAGGDPTLRDIYAGEELLDNYLDLLGDIACWAADVEDLRAQCIGIGVGHVVEYETEYASELEEE